ncbi:hypothetical protein QRD02_00090 [Aequorivita sp. SDUM287046]|uniref:Flippase-like domain-containing protein n=1 Tax=Aequorivita aurantiaca TaxID=3053356 RepID=A0ABT8DFU8_9FLAO|nr:lysylphosphatidylglycerol synthase domain-containing protein [Aequorivita aurantiaca]MDN3722764.1 hypothetical protein [Aequorivita aurantiaca]
MISISHKTKQYLLVSAKVSVLAVTFGYIFYKITFGASVSLGDFITVLSAKATISGYLLLLFTILAAGNWFFEILKWQNLVSVVHKITFATAMKQCLASLTVSLATPNRIGEYGAKAIYFAPAKRRKILLLNLISSSSQMLITSVFGLGGLLYFMRNFSVDYSVKTICYLGIGVILLFAVGYYFKEKELLLKGFSISKAVEFFREIPFQIKLRALVFSAIRYFIFSGMFYGLLVFFGADIKFSEGIVTIFAMYFFVSVIPTFFIFDVVIRGGVAVWLFSFLGVPELTIVSTVLATWLLNFVLPAIFGSIYVLTYQPATK